MILTAFNNTYPAGITATAIVEVVEKQIHYADANGTNPVYPYTNLITAAVNIQTAIDAATFGDIVLVNDGIYYPTGQIYITNNITVKSINSSKKTIVNGNNSNRCFY